MSYGRAANGVAIIALISCFFVAGIFFYFNKVANDLMSSGSNIEYYAQYLPA